MNTLHMSNRYGKVAVHQVNSIEDRILLIGQQVDKSQQDPRIRAVAYEVVRGTSQHGNDHEDQELSQLFWFIKNNIEYRQDARDYDTYAVAWRTLEMKAGDCDCHTILLLGLAAQLGYLTGAKVISPDGVSWHIYPIVGVRSKAAPSAIMPLDTTQPNSFPGWEPPILQRKKEIMVTFANGQSHIKHIR